MTPFWITPSDEIYEFDSQLQHSIAIEKKFGIDYTTALQRGYTRGWADANYLYLTLGDGVDIEHILSILPSDMLDVKCLRYEIGEGYGYIDIEIAGENIFEALHRYQRRKQLVNAKISSRNNSQHFYRCETQERHPEGMTAFDIVMYEKKELGNSVQFKHLTKNDLLELKKYSGNSIVWVTKNKRDAGRYKDYGEMHEVTFVNPKIIAEDGDGGYLVLEKAGHHVQSSIKISTRDTIKKFSDKFMSWFNGSKIVDSQGQPLEVYHGTSVRFKKFNLDNAGQNIIWFTTNRQAIESKEVGAAGHGFIVHMYAKITNPAGMEEYEKLTLDELEHKGYDGVVIPKDDGNITGFVFYPEQLRVTKSLEVKK